MYIYIRSVGFLFGVQILQPITEPADFGNGKRLSTLCQEDLVEPSIGRLGLALVGSVGVSVVLNKPNYNYLMNETSSHQIYKASKESIKEIT